MRLLAIDGATEQASVALWIDGAVMYRERLAPGGHGDWLLATVHEVLAQAACPLTALDALAFGRGPGSFTGLRVVAAMVQGLAFGADLGVIPVSDLAMLAQDEAERGDGAIIAALDARMGEVYWSAFQAEQGAIRALAGETVSPPEAVCVPIGVHGWRGAGNAWLAYPNCLPDGVRQPDTATLPSARSLMALGISQLRAGRVLPPEAALPVYVRDQVVQSR
ncbi:MAG: tRNA (adenosine(37)-N6)-threonylcarbamoyltransferase complex dimerization subunit type 1 TsaB [Candidatus Macondimonas sp.]